MTRVARDNWCCGNYNAYVAQGKDKQQRQARYSQVPEEFKAEVMAHLQTLADIKRAAELKKRRK